MCHVLNQCLERGDAPLEVTLCEHALTRVNLVNFFLPFSLEKYVV